jgi:formate dehydrogenase
MSRGTVALPHGWGHRGGWQLANRHGGTNVNLLSGSAPDDLERLAGMAHLNGIPVRATPARTERDASPAAAAAAP